MGPNGFQVNQTLDGADDDDEGLFDRESDQKNVDEETVLMETAGFLPLKNICSQLTV